jgi:tetratricopeptide (TPR) repeat protein
MSMNKLCALAAALMIALPAAQVQAQALRPEVGKPLQQASAALKAGNAKEAMAKVREADAVGGKTPAESLMVERMRAAAAQRLGDHGTAARSLEAIHPRVSGAEAAQVAEQLAFAYSQTRDFGKAKEWLGKAQAAGGNSAQLKQLAAYLQSQSGDYGAIAREAAAAVAAAEQAGRRPDEGDLLRLADAQQRTGNAAGQTATLEKLLANYPKKDYWAIYLGRVQRKPGFSDRFALEVMRLKLALGTLSKTEEYMEMAQLAIQAGYPAEGKAIVDKGFAAGALGTGAEADRHKRLRELADKRDADAKANINKRIEEASALKDGNDLVQLGYALVTMGQADKGIGLIEQGIAKGGLKRPDDAKLRLGVAHLLSGKNKAKAVQILRGVQGNDGAADLGRLWSLYANTQG